MLILQLFLVATSLTILILLYKKLITWWIKFKKWQKEIFYNNDQAENQDLTGQKAPFFYAVSLKTGKIISIEQITNGQIFVIIFMDSTCAFCNTHFEAFSQDIQDFSFANYAIIMPKEQKSYAEEYYKLFDGKINVYLVDNDVYEKYKIHFFPAFVLLDEKQTIIKMTPIPAFLLNDFRYRLQHGLT
ncbi:peroxiredoxin family protein [Caenibacillus caldisaponilyticus]|uniref:peroxiredoxin family protein n=1 Tax=Caenibacillus caldisaponilyticus TaxID=1674942 RepID=UPI0009886739|nr:thioredoxin fold domain-containing protein [Caenibacillus caldisaponilyticus]